MTIENVGASFEGWALIELFGHNREAGFVTTRYFGDKAMFQIDVPEIPERTERLQKPDWITSAIGENGTETKLRPAGTEVTYGAIPGRTRLVNPGAVYALNPAGEEAVRRAVANAQARQIVALKMPEVAQLPASVEEEEAEYPPDNDDSYMESDEDEEDGE